MKKFYLFVIHLLLLLLVGNFLMTVLSTVRRGFAIEVMNTLSECRKQAKAGDAVTAASCLGTAVGYYPSGTVIKTSTSFDVLVENDRDFTVDYIIMLLKEKTKLDLGNDPKAWLSYFDPKK